MGAFPLSGQKLELFHPIRRDPVAGRVQIPREPIWTRSRCRAFESAHRPQHRAITDLRSYHLQVHEGLFALPKFYRALFADEPAVTGMKHWLED